jgi:transposase InsO family protein
VLRAYPRCDQKTAIAFIDDVMAKLPFAVERIQTDNGSEFGASFHWHLLDKRIDHVRIKPGTPRLNGKVEKSHRIDSEEFYRLLQGQLIEDAHLFTEKLQEWEDYYNYHRPHGALGGQTPYEGLRQEFKTRCHRPSSVAHAARGIQTSATPSRSSSKRPAWTPRVMAAEA